MALYKYKNGKLVKVAGNYSSPVPKNAYLIQKTGTVSPASVYGGTWIKVAENVVLPLGSSAPVVTGNVNSFSGAWTGLKWRTNTGAALSANTPIIASNQYDATYNATTTGGLYLNTPIVPANLQADLSSSTNKITGVDIWLRES